jgi:ribosomal protein S18 acetylase RimI-like enzyme
VAALSPDVLRRRQAASQRAFFRMLASSSRDARCNDRAHGVLEPWSMAAPFERAEDPLSHLYAARVGGEVASALVAREYEGDCYFWFVATAPESQGRGLASELMRHALREARGRGCDTTTLESTSAGELLYSGLGYAAFGRFEMWERRSA